MKHWTAFLGQSSFATYRLPHTISKFCLKSMCHHRYSDIQTLRNLPAQQLLYNPIIHEEESSKSILHDSALLSPQCHEEADTHMLFHASMQHTTRSLNKHVGVSGRIVLEIGSQCIWFTSLAATVYQMNNFPMTRYTYPTLFTSYVVNNIFSSKSTMYKKFNIFFAY